MTSWQKRENIFDDSSCTSLVIIQFNASSNGYVPPPGGVYCACSSLAVGMGHLYILMMYIIMIFPFPNMPWLKASAKSVRVLQMVILQYQLEFQG